MVQLHTFRADYTRIASNIYYRGLVWTTRRNESNDWLAGPVERFVSVNKYRFVINQGQFLCLRARSATRVNGRNNQIYLSFIFEFPRQTGAANFRQAITIGPQRCQRF